ncbi:MAG: purine-binding chemotaxis protein CheW [Deltaproteobacteria bacterium]|nr:purine-binding chemotaxis protein CheW [Deltaproteobacteria bacterium]
MAKSNDLVVFTLDEQRYALRVSSVQRVIRAVEIIPLPKAPEIVLGMVNVQGRIIPVFNIRKRFRLPERELELSDQIVLARTSRRTVGLVVDAVSGVLELSESEILSPDDIVPETEYVEGVVKLKDGLVLIHDLNRFLSLDEERTLDASLNIDG